MSDTPDDWRETVTENQQTVLDALPATIAELSADLGKPSSTLDGYMRRMQDNGVPVDYRRDGDRYEWFLDGDSDTDPGTDDQPDPWTDTPVADTDPSPQDLTEREQYIATELQTGATVDELAEDLDVRPTIVTQHLRDLRSEGWEVYLDSTADLVTIEGDHTLRSSEHKGTRTRKANRWWELRHNNLVRHYKTLTPPTATPTSFSENEDWVTHLTDLHAGDKVRGYDDDIVHETAHLPPIIDHITERSLTYAAETSARYDTAYLLWGGDFVTNEGIYEGQFEDLDAWLDGQVDTLHDPLLRQVKAFSERFETVRVICQAGNHGDIRADGSSKQANADLLLYKSLRNTVAALAELGHCDNVEFTIGRAGSPTPFWMRGGEIHGQLRHGQQRKPQAETSARRKEWLSTVIDSLNFGQPVDMIWMGHYHVSGQVPWNGPPIFVTNSPLPVGEYPRELGEVSAINEPDIATCHGVDDDGVTSIRRVSPHSFDP